MSDRALLACAWTGVVGLILTLAGFLVAGYIPPPRASDSAAQIADFYAAHPGRTQTGVILLVFGLSTWAPLVAGMSAVMARAEERRLTLTILQAVIGAVVVACLMLFALLLGGAAFRPERSPEITQALHDIGWFMAFLAVTPFAMQALTIAAATLSDRSADPLLPRWFGYLNGWVAFLLLPGVLLIVFKTGPFSYHGVIGFWIPLGAFAVWMLALAWAVRRAALRGTG